ncbi:MAG: PAS domain-containing protein [Microscillaceae bacterium]|nr:PAS domain-containing protein [Microscillaceae bacterium]
MDTNTYTFSPEHYEKTLLSILDSQSEMICRCTVDTQIIFINSAYADFLGKKVPALMGKPLLDFLSSSQKRKLQDNINYLLQHKKNISYEHRILADREQTLWQRWTYTPVLDADEKLVEFQAIGIDISHTKVEQEKARNAEKYLYSLINSHKDAFFLLGKDLQILSFNKAASAHINQHWDKSLSKDLNMKDFTHPEDLSTFITDFDRSFQGEFIVREKQFNALAGLDYWYEQSFSPVVDDLGNIFAVALRLTEITKQKEIEKQIKRKRIEQKIILDNLPHLVWLKDQHGRFLSVNQPFAKLTNKRKEEIIGKTDFEVWEKKQAQEQIQQDQEIIKSGKQKLIEELIDLGKDQKWFETYKVPVYDENGNIIGTTGTTLDITHRKKIALQLESLQQDYLRITNHLDKVVFLFFDTQLKYTFVEGQALKSTDFNSKKIIGKTPEDVFPPKVAQALRRGYEACLQGKNYPDQLFIYEQVFLIYHMPCVLADQKGGGVSFMFDMSEHHLPEKEKNLHATQNFFEETNLMVFSLNKSLKIRRINTQVAQVLGYSPQDIVQYSFSEILLLDSQGFNLDYLLNITSEEPNKIFYLITKKGQKIPVSLDINKSSSSQYLVFCKDLSFFQAKIEALEQARLKAENEAAIKSQFLSTMSHEIRTPLNAVIAMTHLLLQENPRSNQIRSLNTLKFSAENLLVIINDILDYNKIESGKIDFESIEFELRELASSIREELHFKAEEKNIHLIIRLDDRIPPVLVGDPVRLSQILTNLMDNAIKFTSEGEVKLEIDLEESLEPEVNLHFAVIDTGIGIDQDKIQSIFERFTQASADTTRKFGGTGLGLAITKKLLELQGSHIEVESTPGLGSRFHFSLRFQKSHKTVLPSFTGVKADKTPQDLNGARVLMVEDNEMNQLVASQFLNKWNAQIDYAQNGEIAIALVQQKEYDIILMDLEMPIMDGYETTRMIRKLGRAYKYLPIIALTASAMSEVKGLVFEAGMNDYVAKPFAPQDLYNKLSKNLHIKKINMEIFEQAQNEETPGQGPLTGENQINFKKIIEISGGNKAFIRKYKELSQKIFQEFPVNYEEALLTRDYEKLRKMNHNIRATIGILDLYALDVEIQNGRRLLKEEKTDEQEIRSSISIIQKLCVIYLNSLDQFA